MIDTVTCIIPCFLYKSQYVTWCIINLMITGIVVCFQCCIIQLNLIFLCIVIPTSYERLWPNLQTSEGFCGALFIAIQIKLCSLTQCNGLHNIWLLLYVFRWNIIHLNSPCLFDYKYIAFTEQWEFHKKCICVN